jgi:hypothetical protein
LSVENQLTSSKNISHRNYFTKRILNLVTYKIDFFYAIVVKFKGPLLKPKPKIIIFDFDFFNIHISHLALHFMINLTLKWHHKNISNKITIFIEFWCSLDMLFSSFDCDCTLCGLKLKCLLITTTKL